MKRTRYVRLTFQAQAVTAVGKTHVLRGHEDAL